MPILKFKGIEKKLLIENSKDLIDSLANIVECDRTWLTIEHIETEYIFDGGIVQGNVFVDFYWFDRGQEKKDKIAKYLTEFCRTFIKDTEITVVFHPFEKTNYYDNGCHY